MRRLVFGALLLLPLVTPASALDVQNDNPNAPQTGDVPKKYPAAMATFRALIPKNLQGEDWLYNLNGVGEQLLEKDIGPYHYLAGWGCKPKFCAQNIVGFLVTPDGKRAVVELSISTMGQKNILLGKPTPAEKKALDGIIN